MRPLYRPSLDLSAALRVPRRLNEDGLVISLGLFVFTVGPSRGWDSCSIDCKAEEKNQLHRALIIVLSNLFIIVYSILAWHSHHFPLCSRRSCTLNYARGLCPPLLVSHFPYPSVYIFNRPAPIAIAIAIATSRTIYRASIGVSCSLYKKYPVIVKFGPPTYCICI